MRPEGAVDGFGADGGAFGDLVMAAVGADEGGEEGEGEESGFWSRAEGRHCGAVLPSEFGRARGKGKLTSRHGGSAYYAKTYLPIG